MQESPRTLEALARVADAEACARFRQPSGSTKGSFHMRSKMLGLAVALSTFGFGVAATTLWIGHQHPQPRATFTRETRYVLVAAPAAAPVAADEVTPCEAGSIGKTVYGGVLNDKAISKPQPVYPAIARSALVSGVVVAEVTVDTCGNVVMARALSGHPLLRQAAIDAAMQTRFPPTRLSGTPVPITGTMTYDFTLQ
jgi:TonB family protein